MTSSMTDTTAAAPIALPELDNPTPTGANLITRRLGLLKNVKVALSVRVGGAELSIDELMALKSGSVLSFPRGVNEPIDLLLDDDVIARGEFVAVGDSLGFRVVEVAEIQA